MLSRVESALPSFRHRGAAENALARRRLDLIGRTLSHYRIIAAIGAGGMGEVYRATDTKLERDVALKLLPAEMASDPERLARFQREARAVAALNHPHIVTIFSVEEGDGVHLLTMELVEGQSLDHVIPQGGLPADRIVEIAGALADALAAAHDKGIVHRDLKPANVMVTNESRVKVLDFGLAKDVRAQTSNDATLTSVGQTQAGVVMGTPAYMSPEQISGRPLDHRTDIFSLGVVLYEMATGRRPFQGTSPAELVSAILRDTPPSVTDVRADLPSDLARIIRRCLEKDPSHRVQTARDVSNEFRDLARQTSRTTSTPTSATRAVATPVVATSGKTRFSRAKTRAAWKLPALAALTISMAMVGYLVLHSRIWRPASRAPEAATNPGVIRSIAVLPLDNYSGDSKQEYFVEGMTDELTTDLANISQLRVISRGSAMQFKGEKRPPTPEIAKILNVDAVVEGSVLRSGDKVRITAQLIDARGQAPVGQELRAQLARRVGAPG
jgi:eukaryotic-like serine/threonine-protein kinase